MQILNFADADTSLWKCLQMLFKALDVTVSILFENLLKKMWVILWHVWAEYLSNKYDVILCFLIKRLN